MRAAEVRAAAHVLQTAISHRTGRLPLPRMAHVYLEHPRFPSLDTNGWKTVFADLRCLDVVKLLGSDPTVRSDLGEILETIRHDVDPAILQLNTPGQDPDAVRAIVQRIAWPGLHVRVALDGWTDNQAARETVEALLPIRRTHGIRVGVNFHVTRDNAPEVEPARGWCSLMQVGFFPGIPVKPVVFRETPETLCAFEPDPVAVAAVEACEDAGAGGYPRGMREIMGRGSRAMLRDLVEQGPNQRFPCMELRALVYLLPNGDVVPCGLRVDQPVGNLVRDDLESLWASDTAWRARDEIARCRGCFQASIQLTSHLYGGHWAALVT